LGFGLLRHLLLICGTALLAASIGGCAGPHDPGKWPHSAPQGPIGDVDLSQNRPLSELEAPVAGKGTIARGLYNWEGEIVGQPAPHGKFARLMIGMQPHQVMELLGAPTDRGFYQTARNVRLESYLFGSDDSRWEMVYPGHGRLVFATQSSFGTGRYLTRVIHDPVPPPTR
ncbi:MAG: hypothetical protein ABI589_08495, partial [Burkholderiales bacterium]